MPILFYDHLVTKDDIHRLIEASESPDNIKAKVKILVEDCIHHHVLSFTLENLPESKHQTFLTMFTDRPYDPEILIFLEEHIGPDFESELSGSIAKLVEEIKKDLDLPVLT